MWGTLSAVLATLVSGAVGPVSGLVESPFAINCSEPNWVGTHGINNQGRFAATLTSKCTIALSSAGSIASLDQHFQANVPIIYTSVNDGPTPETFRGLAGVLYDVTLDTDQGGDHVSIRSNLHVATDQASRYLNVTNSTQINGTGNSAFLKVLNEEQTVTKDPNHENTFEMNQTQSIELEKPWYAPSGIFVSEAEKSLMSSFNTELKDVSQATAEQLLDSDNLY